MERKILFGRKYQGQDGIKLKADRTIQGFTRNRAVKVFIIHRRNRDRAYFCSP